jgi:hypothetical protein
LSGSVMTAPAPEVRQTVRDLLLSSESYHALDPEKKREMARAMVQVCQTAVSLLQEEAEPVKARSQPMAMAQGAGQQFSGVATDKLAGTTRAVLNAVSFPRFVTELINGVFKALIDSNQQQMQSYVELIKNVAASTEGFADLNMAPTRARQWLIDTFPGSLEMSGGPDEDTDPRDVAEEQEDARLRWKEGGAKPSEQAMRTAFGLDPSESVPTGDPETTLVPFARRALAKQRQGMLSTMVMLGMQRIVIESGRLNASMRFHIDTRSAANSEDASRFDFQNKVEASGKLGFGPWGMEAKMTNTIGYVSTQKNQTTEEMNTDVDLNSSVELYFKTDYLPLDRMAGKGQVDRIKVNTLNPDAEEKEARQAREQRTADARKSERSGMTDLDKSLVQAPISTPKTDESPAKASPAEATKKASESKSDPAKAGAPKGGGDKKSDGKTAKATEPGSKKVGVTK